MVLLISRLVVMPVAGMVVGLTVCCELGKTGLARNGHTRRLGEPRQPDHDAQANQPG